MSLSRCSVRAAPAASLRARAFLPRVGQPCVAPRPQSPGSPSSAALRAIVAVAALWSCVACGADSQRRAEHAPLPGSGAASAPERHSATSPEPQAASPFSEPPPIFEAVSSLARARLSERDSPATLSEASRGRLAALTYDEARGIRFRPERALFHGEPGNFEVQLFHLGHQQLTPVRVHVVDARGTREVPYDPAFFQSERVELAADEGISFAGLRVHAPINTEAYRDELIVFQGASYFRSLGRGQVYGLSARGLAIDTGVSGGEEFPRFSSFWIVRPEPGDAHIWIVALLESARATGSYAFRVSSGAATRVEVSARVFFREIPQVVGIAPLTSMYLFGEERPARFGDFRPEVHDSDTLVVHGADGEWLARPLRNPARTTVTSFRAESPRGFGLAQRDRAASSYEDLETLYERRPSAFVEPIGDWGPGAVRLLEIQTELETDDNIAAMWVPDRVGPEGLSLRYRLSLGADVPGAPEIARAVATRVATGGQFVEAGVLRFVVDFARQGATPLVAEGAEFVVDVSEGAELVRTTIEANPHVEGLRAVAYVRAPAGVDEIDLRGFVRGAEGQAASETWVYLWQREVAR